MTRWKQETARYRPLLAQWAASLASGQSALMSLRLSLPTATPLSRTEAVAIQLVSFTIGNSRGAAEVVEGARAEWDAGRFVMVSLSVRLLLEFNAATWVALEAANKLVAEEPALGALAEKVERLVAGARYPVRLPAGGVTTVSAINVQTFIERLERHRAGALNDYALLSAGSHPCHLQQLYLHMAGASGDNWSNPTFATHAHEILARLVAIGGAATAGLAEDTRAMTELLRPLLRSHCEGA